MEIDRQRIAAVRALEAMGYTFHGGVWAPAAPSCLPLAAEADAMHRMLMRRADALVGCTEGSDQEAELEAIVDLLEAYEAKHWPFRKEPGGKG